MYIERFLKYLEIERHYSPHTCLAYKKDLYAFCAFYAVPPSELKPRELTTDDIRHWLVTMMDNGLSKRSACRHLSAMKSFFDYLLRHRYVDVDITQKIISPKIPKTLPVFFTQAEMRAEGRIEAQASTWQDFRDNFIIQLFYQTGMRRSELVNLKKQDFDLADGTIRVFGKRRKERLVPIDSRLRASAQEYFDALERFHIDTSFTDALLVCSTHKVKVLRPIRSYDVYRIVTRRMGSVVSSKKHSPHVLRHTFATALLDNGCGIRIVQEVLGHAKLDTTTIYTHTSLKHIMEVYKKTHPRALHQISTPPRKPTDEDNN